MAKKNPESVDLPYFDHLLDLINRQNPSVTESFGRHVHWGYWENPRQATGTVADFAEAAEQLTGQVCQAAHLGDHQAILDVGCGFGGTLAHLNDSYQGMRLTGLNIDERQLQRARQLVQARPGNQVRFELGNACQLPFPDQSFDAVLAVECIFHFPDRQTFFQEACRVLRPGGYLALSDFVPTGLLHPFTKLPMPVGSFYGRCNFSYSKQDYLQLADKTGFTPRVLINVTKNTLPTYSYLRHMAAKQKIGNLSAALETLVAEGLSRSGLMEYAIFGWQKNRTAP